MTGQTTTNQAYNQAGTAYHPPPPPSLPYHPPVQKKRPPLSGTPYPPPPCPPPQYVKWLPPRAEGTPPPGRVQARARPGYTGFDGDGTRTRRLRRAASLGEQGMPAPRPRHSCQIVAKSPRHARAMPAPRPCQCPVPTALRQTGGAGRSYPTRQQQPPYTERVMNPRNSCVPVSSGSNDCFFGVLFLSCPLPSMGGWADGRMRTGRGPHDTMQRNGRGPDADRTRAAPSPTQGALGPGPPPPRGSPESPESAAPAALSKWLLVGGQAYSSASLETSGSDLSR
eukprot:gene24214-biopygen22373